MIKQYKVLDKIKEAVEKTNPLVTKDIMEKFEKFGTSPVFSRDGTIQTFKFIKPELKITSESELKDFYNELEKYGYNENDFWFVEYDSTKPIPNAIYPIEGSILIISKKSGKSKEYQAGNATHWVADFSQDLMKGFYN